MGAFGAGPFENDDALGFLGGCGVTPSKAITKAIGGALASKRELSSSQSSCVVAAAYLILCKGNAALAKKHAPLLEASGVSTEDMSAAFMAKVIPDALEAIERVRNPDNHLAQEWQDAGLHDDWIATLNAISTALKKVLKALGPT